MEPFHEYIAEYRELLKNGAVKNAYRGLMEYIMDLRTYFKKKYPDYFVSGSIYQGYMDMTFFSFFPESIKQHSLKIAIVFLHEAFRFEAWLVGFNKQIQAKYWRLLKDSGWNKYHLVPAPQGTDSILECILAEDPDFSDLPALTKQIEHISLEFIQDVDGYLSTLKKTGL